MPLEKNKNRIVSIDIARGIGIILMVIGHMPSVPILFRNWIFSFHMPLFFVISGMFFCKTLVSENIKKTFRKLIVPYIVYSFSFILTDFIIFNDYNNLTYELKRFALGQGGFDILWFFICLFLAQNFYNILYSICDRYYLRLIIFAALLIACYGLSSTFIGNVFKVSPALYGTVLYGIGHMLSKKFVIDDNYSRVKLCKCVFLFLINLFLFILNYRLGFDCLDMNCLKFGCMPLTIISAVSGSVATFLFSECITNKVFSKVLIYIGKNSKYFFPIVTYVPVRLADIFQILFNKQPNSIVKIVFKFLGFVFSAFFVELNRIKKHRKKKCV